MNTLAGYKDFLLDRYSNLPQGRYVNMIVLRETKSETIFRTEGSGEPLNREFVHAGLSNGEVIPRVVISKRKQTAVERRTGRELLRSFGLLKKINDGAEECMLNTNNPCERCVDCWLYGFAAGGGGAQKSRVITEDAFSLLPASSIVDTKTFNALFDNSTMRHPITGDPSTSISESEYVKPEAHFLDIEVFKDVTADELIYTCGNILRSSRYGAISSRIGRVQNTILAVVFSRAEICSSLELTQTSYDRLTEKEHPLHADDVAKAVTGENGALAHLLPQTIGGYQVMEGQPLAAFLTEIHETYKEPEPLLRRLDASYPAPAKTKKGR
jgi:CRISPR-associated protein Csc2